MTQICPDCKEEFPDTDNYCGKCGAKLPNAWKGLPDYKIDSNTTHSEIPDEYMVRVQEYILRTLNTPEFQEKLLKRILSRASKGFNSDSEYEKFLCSEVLEMCRLELAETLKI